MTYNKQRNSCVTILCKTEIEFYINLDNRVLKGNKKIRENNMFAIFLQSSPKG